MIRLPESEVPPTDPKEQECRTLWLAVIECAITDAKRPEVAGKDRTGEEGPNARAWIFDPKWDLDFRLTCDYAGLDPEWVREQARRFLSKPRRAHRPTRRLPTRAVYEAARAAEAALEAPAAHAQPSEPPGEGEAAA